MDLCDGWHRMGGKCKAIDFGPGIKRCPNCQLQSFRVSGCNRITCPRCRQSCCYQCGLLWFEYMKRFLLFNQKNLFSFDGIANDIKLY